MINVCGRVLGDRLQQPHVVVDVVEDPEAEHDVAVLDLRDPVEHVAEHELVPIAGDLVVLEVLVRRAHEVRLVLDADDVRGAVLQRREAEPSVVTREIEDRVPCDELAVGVNQCEVARVEAIEPRPGLTRLDESRKVMEEARGSNALSTLRGLATC